MIPAHDLGKLLVLIGLGLAVVGLCLWTGLGKGWFGRLPGDVHYSKGNLTLYVPIVTSLLISLLLSVLVWLFRR